MSGASRSHNRITVDITIQLGNQLIDSACEVFASEMRVRTSPEVSYFYPDIIVVCGEPRFEDDTFDTLLNPIIVIEVLSPSTAAFDRGEKFEQYKQIASLEEYILISQDRVRVEHYPSPSAGNGSTTPFRGLKMCYPSLQLNARCLYAPSTDVLCATHHKSA